MDNMKRLNVTKTFLPPIEEYRQYVQQIWESDWLTNQGPLLQEFEQKIGQYLGVSNFHFVGNGTLAIMVALQALDVTEGEVITTPFSYVATTSAIMWQGCRPVFVDIDPQTLCIDPNKIEAAITPATKAILPVHVFGNPCDIEAIDAIAKKHNLKVIYDAAHAFNVTYNEQSIFNHGDISIGSFHATKLFHTVEGGSLVVRDKLINDKVELIKRFGHQGDEHVMLGINAKASEFHAAMGLCNLKYVDDILSRRKTVAGWYDELLGDSFERPVQSPEANRNYAYYPVLMHDEKRLLSLLAALNQEQIFPRRYFYPSLNKLPYVVGVQSCPVSEDIANRIVCLPLHPGLERVDVEKICNILKQPQVG